ncbi:MAG: single-stranded DNA-binding protein [Methanotrichaceae archaeon]|nr:single-stranded DNA-binding protein [Methanotrichaceae archaeon]
MYNKVIIIGNLGRDPEMRFTPNGSPVTTFTVATNHTYTRDDGEKQVETEWFNVVAWNKTAERCNQFLGKGKRVYVEGRQRTRSWEGQDGQRKFTAELVAEKVLFLEKGDRQEPGVPAADEDLPF